jgi:membrane protein required for colicin V production
MKTTIDSTMEGSFMFPILVKTGDFIMQIDPSSISDDINATIDKAVDGATQKILDETKKKIKETLELNTSNEETK